MIVENNHEVKSENQAIVPIPDQNNPKGYELTKQLVEEILDTNPFA